MDTITIFKKKKLKKQWRFWRLFKRFFLVKKKKVRFYRLKWIFNQKRIIWHQMSSLYGTKTLKKLSFKKTQTKYLFGIRFFKILPFLELRLDVLVLRLGLAFSYFQAREVILKKKILVNGIFKKKHYLVRVGDIIQRVRILPKIKDFFLKNWRSFRWKRWKNKQYKTKLTLIPFFKILKKNVTLNFLEINYKIFAGIVLRCPFWGEILLENKRRILFLSRIKKLYFLY